MTKSTERPLDEVRQLHASQRKLNREDTVYVLNGFGKLTEAAALAVTSGFAIYSAHFAKLPEWGHLVLTCSGSLIAILAFLEFVKVLNRRG